MNLQRGSIFFLSLYLGFISSGSIQKIKIYDELIRAAVGKKNFMNAVKDSCTNVMDDFRGGRYLPLSSYSYENIDNSIFHSEERYLDMERKEVLANLLKTKKGERIIVSYKGTEMKKQGMRRGKLAMAKISERKYFYGYLKRYHKRKDCGNHMSIEMSLFSSMEEAAKKGFFPCEKCILRNMR